MTAEFATRLRPGNPGARERRRFGERFRRQRGADVPVTRRSDTAATPGQTLEAVLTGAWEDLVAGCRAECPVCGGQMEPKGEGSDGGGSCLDCGSMLT